MGWPFVWQPWQVSVFGILLFFIGMFTQALMAVVRRDRERDHK